MNPEQKRTIPPSPSKIKGYITAILFIILIWGSSVKTESSIGEFIVGFPNIMDLLGQMFPPNWGYFNNITDAMLETIRMAVIGTTFGAILSIPVTLFSASNLVQNAWIFYPVRFILNLIRTIPDLLLAAIFVAIFGLGSLPGILSLTVFSIGIIAKLTYEAIESIDQGPLEAMTAVGANKIQLIVFGVIPQVLAYFISYILYTFEINVRAAAVLGLVGAGGIGLFYNKTLGFLEYDKASSIILYTLVVVLFIDFISTKLREKLI
ncbi:phosphonate ABC transporter, permease protein PhnE [Neobacillus mesonae]|uniref:phosphonate ABC transporter, permease protein PhnE n=1 Tax=Neobacillus mesonae TaxID=1193713 RepID=UPI00203E8515|nr:phosphonate ABC transporter, permease protein PhnE [Neobacillus mesonae]MCM3570911.1 phosphonate ABC transporter, permease protein PhnE [Neobacillus mesonae]